MKRNVCGFFLLFSFLISSALFSQTYTISKVLLRGTNQDLRKLLLFYSDVEEGKTYSRSQIHSLIQRSVRRMERENLFLMVDGYIEETEPEKAVVVFDVTEKMPYAFSYNDLSFGASLLAVNPKGEEVGLQLGLKNGIYQKKVGVMGTTDFYEFGMFAQVNRGEALQVFSETGSAFLRRSLAILKYGVRRDDWNGYYVLGYQDVYQLVGGLGVGFSDEVGYPFAKGGSFFDAQWEGYSTGWNQFLSQGRMSFELAPSLRSRVLTKMGLLFGKVPDEAKFRHANKGDVCMNLVEFQLRYCRFPTLNIGLDEGVVEPYFLCNMTTVTDHAFSVSGGDVSVGAGVGVGFSQLSSVLDFRVTRAANGELGVLFQIGKN